MFGRNKERFEPDLIDLELYEMRLLYNKKHGKAAIPVMPIPHGISLVANQKQWTESELRYMKDNRERAIAIRQEIYGK